MPDHRWLIMRLEAPLMSFGGVAIDHMGVIRDFPALSMLTGLFGNALGWQRTDWQKHQSLQDRLVYAACWERSSALTPRLTDTQNAKLEASDKGWTSWGQPEGRNGASYGAPHRRQRDYHTDGCVLVALRLVPPQDAPDLETLAEALDYPARPLFLGRKTCLPSAPLRQGFVEANNAYQALQQTVAAGEASTALRAMWPVGEGPAEGEEVERIFALPDLRNWRSGLHGGTRRVVEGRLTPSALLPEGECHDS